MPEPRAVTVPLCRPGHICGDRSPKTNLPCNRRLGHTGRHAFIRAHVWPGLVREVWDVLCQVCHWPTRDGAVCRECGS